MATEEERYYGITREIRALLKPAAAGNRGLVERLVNSYHPLDRPLILADALCQALTSGEGQAVEVLLECGADPDHKDKNGRAPLYVACSDQVGERGFAALLARRPNLQILSGQDYTPLHIAAGNGNVHQVRALVAAGADLHARSTRGLTPLHVATLNPEVVRILVAGGAELEAREENGCTPLFSVVHVGGPECVQAACALLRAGADLHAVNAGGRTPADIVAARWPQRAQAQLLAVHLQCTAELSISEHSPAL